MSTDSEPQQPRNPARGWIVATAVLLVGVLGLGAYALALRSDVDDKDAQIAAQQQQLKEEQQKGVRGNLQDAAAALRQDAGKAFGELGAQLDQIQSDNAASQEETQQAIERAEQAAADARARAGSAQDEVDKVQARADEAGAKADAATACARGYLSAIRGALGAGSVSAGVAQAKSEIGALNASCAKTLGS